MPTSTLNPKKRRARIGYYSEVSRDTAYGISKDSHEPQARRIYAALFRYGKLTRHQLSKLLNIPLHTVCARVNQLMKDGMAIDTEETIMNLSTNSPNNLVEAVVKELELFGR